VAEQDALHVEVGQLAHRLVPGGRVGGEPGGRPAEPLRVVQRVPRHQQPGVRVEHGDVPRRVPGRGHHPQPEHLLAVAHRHQLPWRVDRRDVLGPGVGPGPGGGLHHRRHAAGVVGVVVGEDEVPHVLPGLAHRFQSIFDLRRAARHPGVDHRRLPAPHQHVGRHEPQRHPLVDEAVSVLTPGPRRPGARRGGRGRRALPVVVAAARRPPEDGHRHCAPAEVGQEGPAIHPVDARHVPESQPSGTGAPPVTTGNCRAGSSCGSGRPSSPRRATAPSGAYWRM
jgi:hypothetical protein